MRDSRTVDVNEVLATNIEIHTLVGWSPRDSVEVWFAAIRAVLGDCSALS